VKVVPGAEIEVEHIASVVSVHRREEGSKANLRVADDGLEDDRSPCDARRPRALGIDAHVGLYK
jgi:hypothetical protein